MQPVQELLGAAVLARRRANEAIVGIDTVEAAVRALDADLARRYDALSPLSWIALDDVERVQDAIAEQAGIDPEKLHDNAIRRAQHDALRTMYRIVLRMSTDRWLVARTDTMYRKTRRVGRLTSTIPEPGRAEVVLADWPGSASTYRDRGIRQVGIGIESLLSLSGRRGVEVDWHATPDGARFAATWRTRGAQ